MKPSKSSNLLVGSTVLFDYPIYKVSDGLPEAIKAYNLEEAKKRPYYGQTGTIMVTAMVDGSLDLTMRLDKTGELVKTYSNFVSVTKFPAADRTEELLEQILAELKQLPHSLPHGLDPR